jgi:glycosyltransferase involved in cell wall biosynthesis
MAQGWEGALMSLIRRILTHRSTFERRCQTLHQSSEDQRRADQNTACEDIGREIHQGHFLSVVIAARDESASLPQLIAEVRQSLGQLCEECEQTKTGRLTGFEIIVVDDGSTDSTWAVLKALGGTCPELRPLRLGMSSGQSAATVAGLQIARGDWIATLDADLQNNPADLVTVWNAHHGYDAVLGWRVHRADVWSKRLTSYLANGVRNSVLGQSIRDTGCSIRLFRRSVALTLPLFKGVHRFWGPLLLRAGCRIIQVPVSHRPRSYGCSHYNLWNRSLGILIDLFGVAWLMHRPLQYEVAVDNELEVGACLYLRSEQTRRVKKSQEVA